MPASSKICESDEYTLYINDLPPTLDKHGINRIFSRFGAVKSIILPEGVKFGFVIYSTYGEAEAAINSLDNQPPLYLKVSFRKQKGEETVKSSSRTNGQQSPAADIEMQQDFRYSNSTPKSTSYIQHGDLAQIKLPTRKLSPHTFHMDPNGYTPNLDYMAYNPYDDLDYASSNAMWSRGCLSIDAAGRRHVSLGRGHTLYHIPNPYPPIEDHIGIIYEHRNPGCYRYGVDELQLNVGKCMVCLRDAILLCSTCEGYYCTRECQVADWPNHKKECTKLPALTYAAGNGPPPVASSINSYKNDSLAQSSADDHECVEANTARQTSSKCINRSQSVRVESNNSIPPTIQRSISQNCNYLENGDTIINDNANTNNHSNVHAKMREPSQDILKKSSVDLASRFHNARFPTIKTIVDDNDFVFKPAPFFPKSNFIEVQIVDVLGPGLYCVQKSSDSEKLKELMTTLHKTADQLPIVSKVVVGKVYAATHYEIWYRALILSENPLKIEYIDYGTIKNVKNTEFRELGDLATIPRYSRIIKLSQRATEKFKNLIEECTINVKMNNVNDDGSINVEVMDENKTDISNNSASSKSISNVQALPRSSKLTTIDSDIAATPALQENNDLPSILDVMVPGTEQVYADISTRIDDYSVTAALICKGAVDFFDMLLDTLKNDCNAIASKYKDFCPQLNDLVCAKKTDAYWVRGRVIEILPAIKILSLDEGSIVEVKQTIPILSQYKKIYTFAVMMTTACKFPVKFGSAISLKITDRHTINGETIVGGELMDEAFRGIHVDIKKWIVPMENKETTKPLPVGFEIKNKCRVVIQSNRGTSIVFVRSLDEEQVERYSRLTQDVARAAGTAENLSSPPSPGDLILSKYIDGNYYRALVLALSNNDIKIVYVDYGNNEVTTLDKLKKMPQSLKERPQTSVRVTLKGIQDAPPTKEAIEYLGMLAANETQLICTLDKTTDSEVTLTTAAGESVNDFVNNLLTPSYKKDNDKEDEDYLRLSDIEVGTLGNVGDTVDVCLLDTFETGIKYVFAPLDEDLINHISQVLPTLLDAYCKSAQKYIPRANELCIAQFEEGWYRGCCVKSSLTPTTAEIYFVDFGNVSQVDHANIRMMQKDFLNPAAFGCICNILGFMPSSSEPSPEFSTRLEALLIPNETYKIKILKYKDLEWTIELPEIRKILIEEGLISTEI